MSAPERPRSLPRLLAVWLVAVVGCVAPFAVVGGINALFGGGFA